MSLIYNVEVHCDNCGNWITAATGPKPAGLGAKALRGAKKAGWSRNVHRKHTDLCASCRTAATGGHREDPAP